MRASKILLLVFFLPLGLLACGDTGIPVTGTAPKTCGGIAGLSCPSDQICVYDEGCDPLHGGADCAGVCKPNPGGKTVPCESIADATSCRGRSDCETAGCPQCGESFSFIGCFSLGKGPQIDCPAVFCASTCLTHGAEAGCNQDPACHAVFKDGNTCDCNTPGCCMLFDRCADGSAICGPTTGASEPCPMMACGVGFTPSYLIGEACAEGCVRNTECLDADQ